MTNKPLDRIRVYVCAPYSLGDVGANVHRAVVLCDRLWKNGFLPICPVLTHFWHCISPKTYEEWMEYDAYFLMDADIVLYDKEQTPGESAGANRELEFALTNDIPVFNSVFQLEKTYPNGRDEA